MYTVKKDKFPNLNPNGRTPALVDHNNDGFTLWEVRQLVDNLICARVPLTKCSVQSVAIIQYLVEQYDTASPLTYTSGPEKHLVNQWLLFQASGQGVYFGQGRYLVSEELSRTMLMPTFPPYGSRMYIWKRCPRPCPRYRKEIRRVLGVLEKGPRRKEGTSLETK